MAEQPKEGMAGAMKDLPDEGLGEERTAQPDEEDVLHLVNHAKHWQLRETAKGTLTDGHVSEELQRDRIRQIAHWLQHFPERLPEMTALTDDGQAALDRARATLRRHRGAAS